MIRVTSGLERKAQRRIRMSPAPAPPWLTYAEPMAVSCTVLFLDWRGSSVMSANPRLAATEFTRRILRLYKEVNRLHDRHALPAPGLVKSLGDGILIVWHNRPSAAKVLSFALQLHDTMPAAVARICRCDPPRMGIGIAAGAAAIVQSSSAAPDFLGLAINLAAKLQGAARPSGVVVDNGFFEGFGNAASLRKKYRLREDSLRLDLFDRPMQAWVSPHVAPTKDWTCLAWPGFVANDPQTPNGTIALNHAGSTVLTHEGLHGKIASLAIWPAGPKTTRVEQFEVVIDDIDTLGRWDAEKTVPFLRFKPESTRCLSPVSSPLREAAERRRFTFLPIRCGLNAIAARLGCGLRQARTYEEAFRRILQLKSEDPSFRIALYDNAGASLPVLRMCLPKAPRIHHVFEASHGELTHLISDLVSKQKGLRLPSKQRLFVLYSEISDLARALHSGQVQIVLGGGAWLVGGEYRRDRNVRCVVPSADGAFLWIEGGAVVSRHREDSQELLKWLASTVLSNEAQRALHESQPYPCSPVTSAIVSEHLSVNSRHASPTIAETQLIFRSRNRLHSNIVVRRSPSSPADWYETWETIKARLCEIPR